MYHSILILFIHNESKHIFSYLFDLTIWISKKYTFSNISPIQLSHRCDVYICMCSGDKI